MSKFTGELCPVCDIEFSPCHDVVVCPECGTPHHRLCYAESGECHYAILHSSDFVYEYKNHTETEEKDVYALKAEKDKEDKDFTEESIYGVSKAELSAFMRLERGSDEYKAKIERIRVINVNIFAGLLSPMYFFYKRMTLFGILLLILIVSFPYSTIYLAAFLLLFSDYLYLRFSVAKIKLIRRHYDNIAELTGGEIDYYDILKDAGKPSVLRGLIEFVAACYVVALIMNALGVDLSYMTDYMANL